MGRKRALKLREPNGRIQRERETAPAEIRRLREAALAGLRDPLWGTELGRLYLEGKITESQMAAGKKWMALAAQFKQAIQSPMEFPEMANFDRTKGGSSDPDSDAGRAQAQFHRDVAERFREAHACLLMLSGAESVVRSVCERDQAPVGYQALKALAFGLSVLVDHWQLTAGSKSAKCQIGK